MSAARRTVDARIWREIRRARSGTRRRSRAIKIRSLRRVGSYDFFGERGDQRVDVCENFLDDLRMRRSDIIAFRRIGIEIVEFGIGEKIWRWRFVLASFVTIRLGRVQRHAQFPTPLSRALERSIQEVEDRAPRRRIAAAREQIRDVDAVDGIWRGLRAAN